MMESNLEARDKQVVHVRRRLFVDVVNARIDTRELDRALELLGVEIVLED